MTIFYFPPSSTVVVAPGSATETTLAAMNAKFADNYGSAVTAVRTASQIGNTTGAADFGAGVTSAQTLRTVIVSNQTAIPVTSTPGTLDFGASAAGERVAALIGNASGANSATNPVLTELTDGAAVYTTVKTAQIPTVLGQTTMAGSLAVTIASNQSAIPVTTTPAVTDFGVTTNAERIAAVVGNASGVNALANPVFTELTDGTHTASISAANALKVDGSAVTQPVSGTVAATQSGNWSTRTQDGAGTAVTSTLIVAKQSLDVNVANTTAIPVTTTPGTLDFGASAAAGRVAALIGNASGANSATNPVLNQLTDGTTAYVGTKTGQLPTTLGQTTMAASTSVTIASNQSSVPVTNTPATLDFGASAAAGRVAALIGNASGANTAANPVLAELSDGAAAYTTVKTAQIPAALGQTTMAASLAVTIASNQTAIPVTSTPGTLDYGSSAAAERTAAQIGNATGAADFNFGAPGAQTLRTASMVGVGSAAASQTNPVPTRLGDGTDYVDTTAITAAQKTISTATKTLETSNFNLGWDGTTHREMAVDTSGNTKIAFTVFGPGNSATAGRVAATLVNGASTVDYDTGLSNIQTIRVTTSGRAYADSTRLDFSSTNVTTGAWVQLIASTAAASSQLNIFCGTGECLELGTGAAASETRVLLIPPGGFDALIPLTIAASTRVSVRAVSATANTGSLVLNLRS